MSDGHSDYVDSRGGKLASAAVHEHYDVANVANALPARQALDAHARTETDYITFSW